MLREVKAESAMRRKYPEQVVCATCADPGGRPNIIPLGWFMPTSFEPPMCAISVGHTRHSHRLIRGCGEFVVAFPTEGQEEAVLFCGSHHGSEVDKFAESGFEPAPASIVKPPLLKGCLVNLECKVAGQLDTGDHTIFSGEILAAHVDEEAGPRIYNMGDYRFQPLTP